MPIYEYRCQSCGHDLEKLQRMSDAPLTDCPECGKSALKRLISAAGFRLKGAGWYETDFKTSNQRNLVESSSPSSAGNGSAGAESAGTGSSKEAPKESKSSDSSSSSSTDKPSKSTSTATTS